MTNLNGMKYKGDCSQPMGICVKTNLGRMVLPSSNCSCAAGAPQGRVTLPPIVWIVMGLGVLLYSWLSNLSAFKLALANGVFGSFITDFANLFLVLNVFGVILLLGAVYEFHRRKLELEAKRPLLTCEQ